MGPARQTLQATEQSKHNGQAGTPQVPRGAAQDVRFSPAARLRAGPPRRRSD
ncbi:Uncharacterised protein [Bordetella pertussis]|nr:Uncharacterised protein [Bordetella pertussis]